MAYDDIVHGIEVAISAFKQSPAGRLQDILGDGVSVATFIKGSNNPQMCGHGVEVSSEIGGVVRFFDKTIDEAFIKALYWAAVQKDAA